MYYHRKYLLFENRTYQYNLTLFSLQTNADAFANSADPDETARNEPFHQDLQCLPFCY